MDERLPAALHGQAADGLKGQHAQVCARTHIVGSIFTCPNRYFAGTQAPD